MGSRPSVPWRWDENYSERKLDNIMKRICLVPGKDLPIPSVMGGAVEELITILIDQNEIEQKAEFTVFSRSHEEAETLGKQYKHTNIIYIPNDSVLDKINNRLRRYITTLLGMKPGNLLDSGYYRKIYKKLQGMKMDAYVAEGGDYHEFRQFAKKFGKEKTYLRIHHHLLAQPEFDGIYGNIIGISEFAKNEWMRTTEHPEINAYRVYNCVNEDKFTKRITAEERVALREQLGIKEDDFVIFYCGRMQEVKGVRELLQAFAKIENPNFKLLLVGNADFALNTMTPFMKEVQKLVEQDKERIRFTGYIENSRLYQYYQCADVQVVPSMWEEAAGLVAIEGMLSGLPLIVTKSGGLVEYAPESVALQIDRDGIVENLKNAIEMLYENPTKRKEMANTSLEHAKQFTKAGFYQKYIEVFEYE